MSIAVFVETDNGEYKKSSFEAVSRASEFAKASGSTCIAITVGSKGGENLGKYGANEHIHLSGDGLEMFHPQTYATAVFNAVESKGINTVFISQTYSGKSLAPLLAVKMNGALVTGVVDLPESNSDFTVTKTCFSNKAFAKVKVTSDKSVLTLIPNSFSISESGSDVNTEEMAANAGSANTEVLDTQKVTGKVVLTEAELVVSGGRGLKGPENWNMIEELADTLGAATACSKPVSDMEWRPHSEHVGQTGITIKPNLYIAVGISGAIQHLAGVGSSKVICVINTDPEAPFFKAADYGIVGDAFEVVPKLIKRAKEIKGLA
ncbi:electron transfer flavoprotein subunit alpha/FixB family protein [bacterium]|nr:electron transfer flavoprotein subunit alpha/FixB family protein [bacterium]